MKYERSGRGRYYKGASLLFFCQSEKDYDTMGVE